ncbi:MAG: DNA repair protein RadC [Sphaerochaetaceae bacterium]
MKKYSDKTIIEQSIKEMPSEQRPREKLHLKGSDNLSDLELIALLVGSGTKTISTFSLSKKILEILDNTHSDKQIDMQDLLKIDGMGLAKATLICAALELGRRRLPSKRRQVIYPSDVYPMIRHYGNRMQEYFLSISLNGAHEIISVNVVSIGLVNHTLVHPREVFSDPLIQRATAVIVAHNHPSGILKPSVDDLNVTKRLTSAGEILGIKVLDHLIFSSDSFRSMLEEDEME